ncbi:MAG: anti-sigma factor family protein [Solirubrobacterales bacterium]
MIRRFLERRRYMREHRFTHAHLSAYLDEDLDGAAAGRVEEHMSICPQCKRVLATLRRTLAGLRELHGEPEIDVTEGVIEALRRHG